MLPVRGSGLFLHLSTWPTAAAASPILYTLNIARVYNGMGTIHSRGGLQAHPGPSLHLSYSRCIVFAWVCTYNCIPGTFYTHSIHLEYCAGMQCKCFNRGWLQANPGPCFCTFPTVGASPFYPYCYCSIMFTITITYQVPLTFNKWVGCSRQAYIRQSCCC